MHHCIYFFLLLAYTVVFCGPAESSAANFFSNKMLFPVSDRCQAEVVTILDRRIQIINTPKIFEYKDKCLIDEFSYVSTFARNGIHALVFVLNLREDLSPLQQNAINRLLQCKGLQPFTFILCTNAEQNDVSGVDAKRYIEQRLLKNQLYLDCFKNLVEFVDFRAIILESRDPACTENYQEEKAKEFIEMIEMISKNGYKKYMNSYMHFAARAYKDAQEDKTRQLNKVLKPHHDKIQQLRSQLTTKKLHNSSLLDSKTDTDKEVLEIEDKIKALELVSKIYCEENANATDPQEIAKERVRISMVRNTYTATNLSVTGVVAAVGGGVGALVGTVLPGVGTAIGAAVGASAFATLINSTGPSACNDCKVQ